LKNNTNNLERRNIRAGKLTVRSSASGNGKTLVGRVAYNSRSEDLGGFIEVIAPGAFTYSLKTTEVFAYWSHDSSQVLARLSNGTLRLQDSATALRFSADLDPATTWGSNAIAALKRGDVTANSFGFAVDNSNGDGDQWEVQRDGSILRTVRKALLFEVSPVSVPAYPSNAASLRNAPAAIREKLLRDADGIADADDSDATCDCTCDACEADNCEECSAPQCEDTRCLDRNCPMQEAASERHLLTSIIQRKLALI
jgi:HK97 family phage prohead protease